MEEPIEYLVGLKNTLKRQEMSQKAETLKLLFLDTL